MQDDPITSEEFQQQDSLVRHFKENQQALEKEEALVRKNAASAAFRAARIAQKAAAEVKLLFAQVVLPLCLLLDINQGFHQKSRLSPKIRGKPHQVYAIDYRNIVCGRTPTETKARTRKLLLYIEQVEKDKTYNTYWIIIGSGKENPFIGKLQHFEIVWQYDHDSERQLDEKLHYRLARYVQWRQKKSLSKKNKQKK